MAEENGSKSALKWILPSLGVPTVLAVIGYVVDGSFEHLLGIPIHDFDPKFYTQVAAEFLIDILSEMSLVGPAICITILVAVTYWWLGRLSNRSVRNWICISAFVAFSAVSIFKMMWYDFPVFHIPDPPLLLQPNFKEIFRTQRPDRALVVKREFICSHIPYNILKGCGDSQQALSDNAKRMRSLFIFDWGFTALGCGLGALFFLTTGKPAVNHSEEPPTFGPTVTGKAWQSLMEGTLFKIVLVTLLTADIFFALSVYGTVVRSTEFEKGAIFLESPLEDEASFTAIIVSNQGNEVVLLDYERCAIESIPKSHIKAFRFEEFEDVLDRPAEACQQ